MRLLRYFLLVASLATSAFMFYAIVISRHAHPMEFAIALGLVAGGVLNFFYILRCPPNSN